MSTDQRDSEHQLPVPPLPSPEGRAPEAGPGELPESHPRMGWWRWAVPLGVGLLGVLGGMTAHPNLPPLGLATYVGQFQAGPRSTVANHGYGSLEDLATVSTPSYRATIMPKAVGMQFLNVSAATLRQAHFVMYAKPPHRAWRTMPVSIGQDGFVGYRVKVPMARGPWTFRLEAARIGVFPPWTVTVDPSAHLLPPSSAGRQALAVLNAVRAGEGSNPVSWSARLELASARHARYVAHFGYNHPSFHVEQPGPYYTGRYPWDRDLAAGWPDTSTGEVGIAGSTPVSGPLFIGELLDTVFHRLGLLSPNAYAVGYGAASGPGTAAEVMDIAYGYRPDLPKAVAYPAPGSTGVATLWTDLESPSPVAGGEGQVFGYPITLDCPTVDLLGEASADLTTVRGTVVPTVYDHPGVGAMAGNQLALVPKQPLAPDTTYVVTVEAFAVKFNNGSTGTLAERWTFRTGGGGQSVYVVPEPHRLLIAVDQAGVGPPPAERVSVALRQGRREVHLAARIRGGVGGLAVPAALRGRWQVVVTTPHGNRGTTWWHAS
jgi:hypothetical protein